ncbi:Hpt domain-containing protein [Deinococcus oregonensis]|uniref:histidine kinase n=1 Tax=Deinococcus oregonensis TaxID=1805970 RepID=A0ABV6B051_9DEIO
MDFTQTPELFESFLLDAWDALAQYDAALAQLDTNFTPELLQRLGLLAHRIKGTAALYGFPQMSSVAELAERLLDLQPDVQGEARQALSAFLERLGVCLQTALERVSGGAPEGELGLDFAHLGGTALLRALLTDHASAFTRHGSASSSPANLTHFRRLQADVWTYFAPEAREHLEALREGLTQITLDASDLQAVFRAAHTLKGSAYMVGFTPLGDLGHAMEDVLARVREGHLELGGEVVLRLLEGTELSERLLRGAEGEGADLTQALLQTRGRLAALLREDQAASEVEAAAQPSPEPASFSAVSAAPVAAPRAAVRVGTDKLDRLMDLVGQLAAGRSRLTHQLEAFTDFGQSLALSYARLMRTVTEFESQHLNPVLPLQAPARAGRGVRPGAVSGSGKAVNASVEELFADLEFDSYSDLNIVARSVAEMATDLGELQLRFDRQLTELRDEVGALGTLTRTLRNEVARARRVPFGQAATRLRRWARTRDGQKPFSLDVGGEGVEVDTQVLEALVDPLLHLVNNALTHGLELPERRAASGKAPEGRISVRARASGPFLEVEVTDDGAGLDVQAVRERAKALMTEADWLRVPESEWPNLIFLPGLSTAKEVTSEAGRGVGMDVVANNLRRLGGEVNVRTAAGTGTTLTLRVPLTQQMTDSLLLQVADLTIAVPTAAVRGLRRVLAEQIQGQQVSVDGELLRLIRLREFWGQAPLDEAGDASERQLAIIQAGTHQIAVEVDGFLGLEELTVRGDATRLAGRAEFVGAAQTANGSVALMLSPVGLGRVTEGQASGFTAPQATVPRVQRTRVLLVDDSVSVRRIVAKMLEEAGYNVVTASDGQEALDLLRLDSGFGALLTDLEMPRVSGYELLEEVRRRPATAMLPVMVMTTRAGDKHQQLATELGANAYFAKPIDRSGLLRRLVELTESP